MELMGGSTKHKDFVLGIYKRINAGILGGALRMYMGCRVIRSLGKKSCTSLGHPVI